MAWCESVRKMEKEQEILKASFAGFSPEKLSECYSHDPVSAEEIRKIVRDDSERRRRGPGPGGL